MKLACMGKLRGEEGEGEGEGDNKACSAVKNTHDTISFSSFHRG